MIDVSFKINGKSVNPNNMAGALESAILSEVGESVKSSLGSVRCSVHHQSPKVTIQGKSFDNLSFEISGCCDELIQKATSQLS